MKRALAIVLRLAGLIVVLVAALFVALNAFLNVGLPFVVNRQPERIKMTYDVVWMVVPGEVEVRNLKIRQQSPKDQWLLTVNNATAEFDLGDFLDHNIHITTAEAQGASFQWRARVGEDPEADTSPPVVEDWTAPIPGFTNPPSPSPEEIYPDAKPWRVTLEDVHVEGVRELWLGDYRFVGDATASGALTLEAHKWLEVEAGNLKIHDGQVTRGSAPMLTGIGGEIAIDLVGSNPEEAEGRGFFSAVTGTVGLTADVANLAFLDVYLKSAPWLHLTGGIGKLDIDISVRDGAFEDGSSVAADVADIVARFLSYSVVGDGRVRLAVGTSEGVPQSTLDVSFLDFAITEDGDAEPHVKGQGFQVTATTPDVALDRPFTSLDVVLELPEAEVPDVRVYNSYLPTAIGLKLQSGTGKVRGHLEVSTEDNVCRGELFLVGTAVRATLDELTLSGDVAVHALVPAGNLTTGEYDISGTSLDMSRIRVLSGGTTRQGKDDSTAWWAKINVPKGQVAVGAPIFLDGNLDVRFRDTVPFITIFSAKQPLPGWIRGLLGVEPVHGKTRLRLGDDVLRVTNFQLHAGQFEVLLELRRRQAMVGKLFARYGQLSLGMGLEETKNHIQVFNARKWYDAEPSPN